MEAKKPPRRRHSVAFRAGVVQACRVPGARVAEVARRHQVGESLVYDWLRSPHLTQVATSPASAPHFVAAQCAVPASIHIELQRGQTRVQVQWPVQASKDCAAWLLACLA